LTAREQARRRRVEKQKGIFIQPPNVPIGDKNEEGKIATFRHRIFDGCKTHRLLFFIHLFSPQNNQSYTILSEV
jgi:hypothetical protein